ncbi:homoserine kinase [Gottfriedia luciferensis]|uniref:homoserine kinase n=1 Tax=Gottfriedia luciferensis TaxID=178774 RepID=UPI000B449CD9|nr:homoserine kinase [Gottfriedia luciferensis]
MKKFLQITVPASTANVGPGFDSIGIALGRYLTINVFENDKYSCEGSSGFLHDIPLDETNLIFETAIQVAKENNKELPTCHLELESNIPLTRGLGSSASAIVGGIILANELCDLQLSLEEQLRIATSIEGHMDNVGASLYGGLVVGTYIDGKAYIQQSQLNKVSVVAIIPKYELETKHARNILPKSISHKDAILSSSFSNVLVSALLTENWKLAGDMMKRDLFHEPYRSKIVNELETLKQIQTPEFVYGYVLSGAGPTVLVFVKVENCNEATNYFSCLFPKCDVSEIKIVNEGATVKQTIHSN